VQEDNKSIGADLVFLLKQQRNLYHQLMTLTNRQRQLGGVDSPELLLRIISGRSKLITKLKEVNDKLRLVRANWSRISPRIGPEHKVIARQMAGQTQQIYSRILEAGPADVVEKLQSSKAEQLDGLFVE